MKMRLPESASVASRTGRQARSTSSMAPPLFSVAQTPRFQTYVGPEKYSNMDPTVPVVTGAGNQPVVVRGIRPRGFRGTCGCGVLWR